MKYFLDTEFHEYKKHHRLFGFKVGKPINTIELISIGIVAEDNREYYAICKDFDVEAAWNDKWLHDNVLSQLPGDLLKLAGRSGQTNQFKMANSNIKQLTNLLRQYGKTSFCIAKEVIEFIYGKDQTEIYGYYADYDWVIFCWLFGPMTDLPKGFPMYCLDVKQMMENTGFNKEWLKINHPDPSGQHSAIVDARWIKELYEKIKEKTNETLL